METKFNFNSQVCTNIEQSRRLLELGLKKETADCALLPLNDKVTSILVKPSTKDIVNTIPAWSIHRLMEMVDPWEYKNWIGEDIENDYDNMVKCIEFLIYDRRFNKKYLV